MVKRGRAGDLGVQLRKGIPSSFAGDLGRADAVEKTGPTSGPRWSAVEGAVHGGRMGDAWARLVRERRSARGAAG